MPLLASRECFSSIVVKVIHGEMIFLFMADIGPEVQRELLAIYGPRLKANVAKIPHHGGESIEPFVQAIRPERAITITSDGRSFRVRTERPR